MATAVTTVDCEKQVRSWRLLRSLMHLLIPTCNCATILEQHQDDDDVTPNVCLQNTTKYYDSSSLMTSTTTITGTIFAYRRGKVSFCIQENANSTNPILLLELAVPTTILAKEMSEGTLRIVLESGGGGSDNGNDDGNTLLSAPLWNMYCNGRKVGYAVKRRPSNTDFEALRLMRSVVVGTGVMNCKEFVNKEHHHNNNDDHDKLMYLRANFQRVRGSDNCESFHLMDPEGDIHQELSIFFFRSR